MKEESQEAIHVENFGKILPLKKNKRKGKTSAKRAELLSDPFIQNQIEKMRDCLMAIIAIRKEEGYDASFDSVWAFVVAKIKEQLAESAGVEKEDFTQEEIDILSEIGFYKEVLKEIKRQKAIKSPLCLAHSSLR
jgi:alpha-mannosidase